MYNDVKKANKYILVMTIIAGILAYLMKSFSINSVIYEVIEMIISMLFGAGIGIYVALSIGNKRTKRKITSNN
ncbi:hypothetical protein CHF27_009555 [Romboutsia maritimum]|uniref:Uncharacterized protein n=1 Tax=Romboutsia maritimum TaxID=2020948 RepID=A0A371IRT8_9FIRM|nr:hypothetical protein [Romboutsia maritimum]RDY23185.1 hypothetical protein CHF27_009555 [Romboutsia maritimum]